ncbi:dTDP-4-dehydrorhamnose 3,5-epimerase [Candidatus Saccharibacteria bacterium]|nr:dTDP-4-dehydrorhamnose 3,5-epimerase [Candidatus Saccharibacteria bacterium]
MQEEATRVIESGNFRCEGTGIAGLKVISPCVFEDGRGYFMETYSKREFGNFDIDCEFVQDNQSKSAKGVLRGLHYQKEFSQAKLVRVIKGEVFDVALDMRPDSETRGKHFAIRLSAENKKQLFIPRGFAHGFLVLSDEAEFAYKVDDFYHPDDEGGILWNSVGIDWPIDEIGGEDKLIISEKDTKWPTF